MAYRVSRHNQDVPDIDPEHRGDPEHGLQDTLERRTPVA
jgi:hypothetical protein